MSRKIPAETIAAFARTIFREARRYGFEQLDFIRLVNALLDIPNDEDDASLGRADQKRGAAGILSVAAFPLSSERLKIRLADPDADAKHKVVKASSDSSRAASVRVSRWGFFR
jgi:hypothetical protein